MARFDKPCMTFYWSAIVTIALSCTIFVGYLTLNNIVTWNLAYKSLKVIETGATRKLWCGFLFAFYSNYGRIYNRLWDIQRQRSCQLRIQYVEFSHITQWPWNLGYVSLEVIGNGTIRQIAYDFLLTFHSNYGVILNRLRDIASYWSKIGKFLYLTCI